MMATMATPAYVSKELPLNKLVKPEVIDVKLKIVSMNLG